MLVIIQDHEPTKYIILSTIDAILDIVFSHIVIREAIHREIVSLSPYFTSLV